MPTQKFQIDDVFINENFRELFTNTQDISHKIVRSVPNVEEIREGEINFFDDGTTRRLYVKLNGVLHNTILGDVRQFFSKDGSTVIAREVIGGESVSPNSSVTVNLFTGTIHHIIITPDKCTAHIFISDITSTSFKITNTHSTEFVSVWWRVLIW